MTGMFALTRQGFLVVSLLLLSACGGGGGGGGSNPPPTNNKPPEADVALPESESVKAGEAITLSAGDSVDPDGSVANITWEQVDGPAIEIGDPNAVELTFTAPSVEEDAEIVIRMTVTDDEGESASVEFTLPVHATVEGNANPVANTGQDAQFSAGAGVTLNGTDSSDEDGQVVSYQWTQLAGPEIELSGADTANPTFIAPDVDTETNLKFRLVVTDDVGTTHSDVVVITVVPHTGGNRAPAISDIGGVPVEPVPEGSELTLTANASDPDEGDTLTFTWTPIEPADDSLVFDGVEFPFEGENLTLTLPDVTEDIAVTLRVTVSDGTLTATRDIDFTIGFENQPPAVGIVTTPENLLATGVAEGQPITFTANATDPDGKATFSYAWNQTVGSVDFSEQLSTVTGPELSLTAPDVTADEAYGFTVTVTDADGAEVTSEEILFSVNFVNQAPVANAQVFDSDEADENTSINLDGRASFDPDGDDITYAWTQTAGAPAAFSTSPESATPIVLLPEISSASEVLEFSLVVVDSHGEPSAPAVVSITVNGVNEPPVIGGIEGPDSIDEGDDLVGVVFTAIDVVDPEGDELTYQWDVPFGFTSGNGTTNPTLELTSTRDIGPDDDGTFVTLTLAVFDAEGNNGLAQKSISLNFVNQPPELTLANITGDTTVTEGTEVSLVAEGSDADIVTGDEQTLGYNWTLIDDGGLTGEDAPPAGSNRADLSFTAPEVADEPVTIRYEVVAGDGLVPSEPPVDVVITITPDTTAPEITAPTVLDVDEGNGISFTLSPSVSDNKTATDALVYEWTVPNGFSVNAATMAQRELIITRTPDVGPNGGSGTFGLSVTDADGNQATANFELTVNFINQAPVLGTITGSRTVNDGTAGNTLEASGTDPDNQPLSFEWNRSANDTSGISDGDLGVAFPVNDAQLAFNTPDVTEDTIITFSVVARDDQGLASDPVDVAVEISSDPAPVIGGFDPAAPALDEGGTLDITVNATDIDSGGLDTTENLTYEWTGIPQDFQASGSASATLTILDTPDVGPGGSNHTFTVIVSDEDGNSVSRDINIHVGFVNQAPSVGDIAIRDGDGNTPVSVPEGPVDLTFSVNATDPDEAEGQSIGYAWSVPAGFTVVGGLNNATLRVTGTPNVIADTTFDDFSVEVTDGIAPAVTKTASFTVNFKNQRPEVDAGNAISIVESIDLELTPVRLTATAGDGDIDDGATQVLTYTWSVPADSGLEFVGGVTGDGVHAITTDASNEAVLQAVPDVTENVTIVVTLTVDDGSGAANSTSLPDTKTVTVNFNNEPPVADAGNDVITVENADLSTGNTRLDGSGSHDNDGQTLSFQWSVPADSGIVLDDPTSSQPAIIEVPDVTGDEVFEITLTVDDGSGFSNSFATDTANLTVLFVNEAPTADAGADITIPEDLSGGPYQLDASASDDPDDQALTFSWDVGESGIVLDDAASATPAITAVPEVGSDETFTLTLTVDDGSGEANATATDTVDVTVGLVNQPPQITQVHAAPDSVDEGADVALIVDAAIDPDTGVDTGLTYEFTQISGPAVELNQSSPTDPFATFTSPDVGPGGALLEFEVIAQDAAHETHGNGRSSAVPMSVTVNFINQSPVIDSVTADQDTVTPGTVVTLSVEASDPDGQDLTYVWAQNVEVGVPVDDLTEQGDGSIATFTAPPVQSLDGHTLEFKATALDGTGLTNGIVDGYVFINLVFENTAPVINAVGATPQSVNEGVEFVLTADVTDPDQALGQVLTYTWTQRDGETPVATINTDPDTGIATVTAPEVEVETDLHFTVAVSDGVAAELVSNEVAVTITDNPIQLEPFAFTDLTHAAPGLTHASNAITVSGLPDGVEVPVSIEGGEYAVDGGAFTSTDGTLVTNGSSIVVRGDASTTGGTSVSVTLTLGEGVDAVSDSFDITAADATLTFTTAFKEIHLHWSEMQGVDEFKVLYQPAQGVGFDADPIADNIPGTATTLVDNGLYLARLTGQEPEGLPVHAITDWEPTYDQYRLVACNAHSAACALMDNGGVVQADSVDAIGYFKSEATLSEFDARFGEAVAVSGDGQVMVAGAPKLDSPNGLFFDNGMIAIYRRDSESNWQLHQEILNDPSFEGENDMFGYSVAVSANGNIIAVGQPAVGNDGVTGDLRVYEWNDVSLQWEEISTIKGTVCSGGQIGRSVAISDDGSTIAVGAPGFRESFGGCSPESYGGVLVFRKVDGESWTKTKTIFSEIPVDGEEFGLDVDLNATGTRLFVATGIDTGEVEVFRYLSGSDTWDHLTTVAVNRPNGKVSGTRTTRTSFISGSAIYTSNLNESLWSMQADLVDVLSAAGGPQFTPSDVALNTSKSAAVISHSGDTSAAAGVHNGLAGNGTGVDVGGAYVFTFTGGWTFHRYVKSSNPESGDEFGASVAFGADGNMLVVGAPGEDGGIGGVNPEDAQDDNSRTNSGAVYVY